MPIDRADYPDNWKEISDGIRFGRAGGKCEECGRVHGDRIPDSLAYVVLTVHHIDHDTTHNDPANLIALCQRCHLAKHRRQPNPFSADQMALDFGGVLVYRDQEEPTPPPAWQASDHGYETMERDVG